MVCISMHIAPEVRVLASASSCGVTSAVRKSLKTLMTPSTGEIRYGNEPASRLGPALRTRIGELGHGAFAGGEARNDDIP